MGAGSISAVSHALPEEVRGRRGPEAGVTCAPPSENPRCEDAFMSDGVLVVDPEFEDAREARRTDVAPHLVARRRPGGRVLQPARSRRPAGIPRRRCPKARRCSGSASAATCWCATAASAAWSSTRRAASRASNASTTPRSPARPACPARGSRASASSGALGPRSSSPVFPARSAARWR